MVGTLIAEFDAVADEYAKVVSALGQVHALFPYGMSKELPPPELVAQASKHLRAAKEAESRGLDLLAGIRKAL